MDKNKTFGIVSFKQSKKADKVFIHLKQWAKSRPISLLFHPACANTILKNSKIAIDEKDLITRSDACISIGGDGTFLSVAHMVKFTEIPVIGINLGGLGFLADIDIDSLENGLDKIANGKYYTIKRMVLKALLQRNGTTIRTFHALNDVFINRYGIPKLASISAWYGNEFITDFQGDGIIIATPSGSTAYSLAAGGPIVAPSIEAFIITPISPHSLTERSIILPANKTIKLQINRKNPQLLLSADGLHSEKLKYNDEIEIMYDGKAANLIQFSENTYFQSLRAKLNWGHDYKQWRHNIE